MSKHAAELARQYGAARDDLKAAAAGHAAAVANAGASRDARRPRKSAKADGPDAAADRAAAAAAADAEMDAARNAGLAKMAELDARAESIRRAMEGQIRRDCMPTR